MFLRLHNQLEDLFDDEHEELILDSLVEVLDVIHSVILLALLEVLLDQRGIQDFLVFVPEQIEEQITWYAKVELIIVVLVWEATGTFIEAAHELKLAFTINSCLTCLIEETRLIVAT